MEKNIYIPKESKKIDKGNFMPTMPTPEGYWADKRRSHPFFQNIVSQAAQSGGVPASAGCPTVVAENAARASEQQYYCEHEKHPKQVKEKNNI